MMFVDGFLLAVPRGNSDRYLDMARLADGLWMEHGALSVVEAMGEDVPDGVLTSFPKAVDLQADEVVWFSFILFRDRAHRDAVNAAVMADPRLTMEEYDGLFDSKRMIFGGFQARLVMGPVGGLAP
jgi:uncharacterized protein YbaA (DUF1428 family)